LDSLGDGRRSRERTTEAERLKELVSLGRVPHRRVLLAANMGHEPSREALGGVGAFEDLGFDPPPEIQDPSSSLDKRARWILGKRWYTQRTRAVVSELGQKAGFLVAADLVDLLVDARVSDKLREVLGDPSGNLADEWLWELTDEVLSRDPSNRARRQKRMVLTSLLRARRSKKIADIVTVVQNLRVVSGQRQWLNKRLIKALLTPQDVATLLTSDPSHAPRESARAS